MYYRHMLFSKVKTKSNFKICLYCTNLKKCKEGEKKQVEDMDLC